ncbi:MAG: hypothetical protein IID09_08400 [Candidatus Hydrogenedentes bacterium]|nr:hypothetical protein [Candidatus Hydrogenedentota bacterium]
MLLNAAVIVILAVIVHRFWLLSRFMQGGAKSGRIFFLTAVSGLCLITNVISPFLVASAIVSLLELRALLLQT